MRKLATDEQRLRAEEKRLELDYEERKRKAEIEQKTMSSMYDLLRELVAKKH